MAGLDIHAQKRINTRTRILGGTTAPIALRQNYNGVTFSPDMTKMMLRCYSRDFWFYPLVIDITNWDRYRPLSTGDGKLLNCAGFRGLVPDFPEANASW
jgi:hypothetical protein